MPEILFHYEQVSPTSWAYLSSLLMLSLYFKFNRVWSIRNLDLLLLLTLSPGLLLVQWAWENMALVERSAQIEQLGFLWLFAAGGLLLARLLFDPAMVRRPLLEPNLNTAGLTLLGGFLLFFLMANIVTGKPSPGDLSPARPVEEIRDEGEEAIDETKPDSFTTDGPGFWLLYRQPRIVTQKIIASDNPQQQASPAEQVEQEREIQEATARVMAIGSHTMIVIGLIVIGHWHFGSFSVGIAVATLYLMLPYTALWTGDVRHALPASLLVWAVVLYRYPLLAGMMVGLASGTIYYPAFLLPLWCSFYWMRGLKRFVAGVLLMIVIMVMTLAFTATSPDRFVENLLQMFGLRLPTSTHMEGIWKSWSHYYRFPILALFVALSISFTIWPLRKNLATLISGSAAIMLGAQFWHAYNGGIFIAWYLPLLLLTIFRPNLEDSTALVKVNEGWWSARRRASNATAQA
jgi:hypothetical protein